MLTQEDGPVRRYVIAWHPPGRMFFLRGDGRRSIYIPPFNEERAYELGWRDSIEFARVFDGPLCFDPDSLDPRWFSKRTLAAFRQDTRLQDRLRIHEYTGKILPTQLYVPKRVRRPPPG